MKSQLNVLQFTINPSTVYISTNPDQSSYANIVVTVVNTGIEPISVNNIAITLPDALAPASTLSSITPVASDPALWSFGPSDINPGEFDATAQNGNYVNINPSDGFNFTLQLVTLVSVITQSAANVTAVVTFQDGSSGQPVLMNVNIEPAVAAIQSFNSNISNISPGENATLNWNCPGISYCIISPIGTNHFNATGTYQVSPAVTTVYTLYAYADGVILSAQWAISVDNVQVVLFAGAEGQTSVNYGDNINLVWECNQYADRVKLTADTDISIPPLITGANTPQKGNVTVGPIEQQTQFTFTAYEGTNFAPAETTISINDVSASLSASPDTGLWAGDKVTFNWSIESASDVSCWPPMENGPSLQKLSGAADYYPGTSVATMLCNLTANGYINNNPATITNEPPLTLEFKPVLINSFTIWPPAITPDNSPSNEATLQWLTQSQVVSIDNGIGQETTQGISVIQNPVNGTVYTLTAGTNQNPVLQTAQVTAVNAFGPYTFNNFNTNPLFAYITNFVIPDPGPMSALMSMGGYTVILTGVVPTGAPSPYAVLNYYNENDISQSYFALMTWPITSDPPYPAFVWADPNNQSGTITLVTSLNSGGGGDTLEDFIKQLLS